MMLCRMSDVVSNVTWQHWCADWNTCFRQCVFYKMQILLIIQLQQIQQSCPQHNAHHEHSIRI